MLREDSSCAWRENGRGLVRLSGLRYGVGAHDTATSRSSCSGFREGWSSRAADCATRAYTSLTRCALGVFAAARLVTVSFVWPAARQHYGRESPIARGRCYSADRTDPERWR